MASPVEAIRARFAETVATMSSRDRKLLVGLSVFLAVALIGGTWWFTDSLLSDARSRVTDREETLAAVQTLAAEQSEAAAQVAAVEEELRKGAGQDLPAIMEKVASRTNISSSLSGVREKEINTQGTLEEKSYNVDLSKVTLQQLTDFLYEAETGGYPLRVRSMKTKTVTVSGVKVLNASLEVSMFRLIEEAATTATGEAKP